MEHGGNNPKSTYKTADCQPIECAPGFAINSVLGMVRKTY